ncbi:hypothetical protein DFX34_RS12945 [Vibrio parahaemolyticus]|nr:hypothetical protein [Vibrio parahaemolyticus]EJF4093366.1 hypothetical protein [Vibrio parahaemolyticus]EJG0302448.1 hypothetical protein [Vibrio parahaemolyticus]EJG0514812.1 hypothetical protein [Vibrio parahaemolyticus]ELB7599881.1 hypothetical protein [Vibrio parahaemolyticus]
MSDVFTVELPWGLPENSPIEIKEFEIPLVGLMQHIIDDLQFKLSQRTAKADEALKQKYQAMLDERTEILAARDRAMAGTEVMRKKRNEAEQIATELREENERLGKDNQRLEAEIKRLNTELRHANQELDGIPKLVENKVAAALANQVASSGELEALNQQLASVQEQLRIAEDKRKTTAAKNATLDEANKAAETELTQSKEHIKMLSELVANQTEQINSMAEGLRNADENYHYVMHNIDEVLAYAAIVTHENEELRNDNLYLGEAVQYHDLKSVWKGGDWQAYMLCKSTAIQPQGGLGKPDHRFGLIYLMNTVTGAGHTAYIGEDGSLCISKLVHESCLLPQEYWEEFTEAAKQVPVAKIETAIEQAVKRTKKVVSVAKVLDLDWCTQVNLIEIAQRLSDYVPQYELNRALTHIERAKELAPRNVSLIKRINKRFNTEYALHSAGGRIPDAPAKPSKPKRNQKRGKRK